MPDVSVPRSANEVTVARAEPVMECCKWASVTTIIIWHTPNPKPSNAQPTGPVARAPTAIATEARGDQGATITQRVGQVW